MLDEWSKHKSTSRLLAENLFRDLAAPSSLVYLPVCWAPLLCSRTYTSLSRVYIRPANTALVQFASARTRSAKSKRSSGFTTEVLQATHMYSACQVYHQRLLPELHIYHSGSIHHRCVPSEHPNVRSIAGREKIFYSPIYTRPAQTCARWWSARVQQIVICIKAQRERESTRLTKINLELNTPEETRIVPG